MADRFFLDTGSMCTSPPAADAALSLKTGRTFQSVSFCRFPFNDGEAAERSRLDLLANAS